MLKSNTIKYQSRIILKQADIISNTESVVALKDTMYSKLQVSFNDLTNKFNKKDKKLAFFRTSTIVFLCTTLIIGGVLVLLK